MDLLKPAERMRVLHLLSAPRKVKRSKRIWLVNGLVFFFVSFPLGLLGLLFALTIVLLPAAIGACGLAVYLPIIIDQALIKRTQRKSEVPIDFVH